MAREKKKKEHGKSIRTSQLISPFGPGAVVELGGESFACMDISDWPSESCLPLQDSNLSRLLGKDIKQPPVKGQGFASVPYARFPRWMFCPNCRRLYHYQHAADKANEFGQPRCGEKECREASLVPMRFVVACEEGHLQDVDWYRWAHRNAQPAISGQCDRKTSKLWFETGEGADFDSMRIICACGEKKSFEGLTDREAGFTCNGKQPWQRAGVSGTCTAQQSPRAYPRGASNIYYASLLTSLDLATDEVATGVAKEDGLRAWLARNPSALGLVQAANAVGNWRSFDMLVTPLVGEASRQFGMGNDEVLQVLTEFVEGKDEAVVPIVADRSQHGILLGEWPYLARARPTRAANLRADPYSTSGSWREDYVRIFEQVTLVHRLREVRALLGFSRVKPEKVLPVDLAGTSNWVPGVESFGEGIFVKFNSAHVEAWARELGGAYHDRSRELEGKCLTWGRQPANVYSSPRFIALHTFAHGLVRRLAFDAGYSSSSLRERIYCGAPGSGMAGVLVYTADSDSEGSLGGLVRQGEASRLIGTLERTMADLSWCSADPVCFEMTRQGVDGMNAAACHSCSLVSETSCMYNNSLLDRRLLVGDPSAGIPGLLADLVETAA